MGDRDYVTRKDAVTISPVHRASLAAASPPHRQHLPAYITPRSQPYQIWKDAPTLTVATDA